MKKKNIAIIILIILILIIGIVAFFINKNFQDVENKVSENNSVINTNNQVVSENPEEINNMKNEINATGSTDIYQIEEEYDGREILQVKPDVQFDVDLAGIIKKSKPEENELNDLLGQAPTGKGIWISEQSREIFTKLLKNNNIENFSISNEGYLKIDNSNNNELVNKINNMINSDKLYIINMTGIAYERDYISGEITGYPFEAMDPYQILEPFQKENKLILEITTNKAGKLNENEILNAITYY